MDTAGSQNDRGATPGRGGRTRAGLAGAVMGVGAAVGALVLVTSGVGAQSATPLSATATAPASAVQADGTAVAEGPVDAIGLDGIELDDEAFEAHWACIDDVLAPYETELDGDGDDGEVIELDLSDEQWEAIEGDLEACDELLPADVLEAFEVEDEAFAAYDQCLVGNGLIEEFGELDDEDLEGLDIEDLDNIVFVETGDGSTIAHFGDGDGTVSISQAGGELSVEVDGDVEVETIDWDELAELDEAWEACEEHLPEDLFEDGDWYDADEYDEYEDEDLEDDEE